MVALLPAEGRRLPVLPPVVPLLAVATCGAPLLVSGLAEASVGTRVGGLRATSATASFAGYLGLTLTVGVLAFSLLLHRGALGQRRVRSALTAGWTVGLAGAITATLVAAAEAGGTRVSGLGAADVSVAAGDPVFRARAVGAGLWLLAGAAVAALRPDATLLARPQWAVPAAVAALALVRLTSVTAARPLTEATTLASLIHLSAMTLWLGGLVTLVLDLSRMSVRDRRRVLPRFSRVAFGAVAVVATTGTALSVAYVASPADLVGTTYGRLVLAKAGLLALILVAARRSQRWVTHRLPAGAPATGGTVRTLMCAVAVEIGLAVGVLGVAAALVTAPGG